MHNFSTALDLLSQLVRVFGEKPRYVVISLDDLEFDAIRASILWLVWPGSTGV